MSKMKPIQIYIPFQIFFAFFFKFEFNPLNIYTCLSYKLLQIGIISTFRTNVITNFSTMFLANFISYINSLNSNKENHVELEIKLLLDQRINMPDFIKTNGSEHNIFNIKTNVISIIQNALLYGTCHTSQTINFINTKTNNMFVKQLCYVNGVQNKGAKNYYSKKSLMPPIYMVSPNEILPMKISINREKIETTDINEFDIIRFRLRYSIIFTSKLSGWQLDLTFIKETRDQSLTVLKTVRDKLFSKPILINDLCNEFDWDYPDRVELEMEYIGDIKKFTISNITQIKQLFVYNDTTRQLLNIKTCKPHKTYQECICEIAQILRPNSIHKFKSGNFGLKQLGSNPIELNKKIYFSDVLPQIDNFMVTEKIDGIRSMLLVYPIDKLCYIINNNHKNCVCVKEITYTDEMALSNVECIILDTESVDFTDTDGIIKTKYYVFDVIKYQTIDKTTYVNKKSFIDRFEFIKTIVYESTNLLIDGMPFMFLKHFTNLTKKNYNTQLREFYNSMSQLDYEIDGLILVSKYSDYHNTLNYKWKPKNTIDFVAKICPANMLGISPYVVKEGKTLYLLFCGIRSNEYKQLGIERFKQYDQMFTTVCVNKYGKTKDSYIPIQFSPSDDPYAYLFWGDSDDMDGKVIELMYNTGLSEWEMFKVRHDRTIDVERKSYYGNYFKFAEYIWMNYKNPLTLNILCQDVKENSYFKNESTEYVSMRKFNNYVKKQIIELNSKHVDLNWVIELASGKGQDMFKYIECGFKNILMTDIDYDALTEIINRKYMYITNNVNQYNEKKRTHKSNYSKIHIKQLDLSDKYKKNVDGIYQTQYGIPVDGAQFVVCNLALHYIIPNKTKSQNFVNMLNKILAPGGIFIFTAFNGKKVFDLLEKKSDENGIWNKYNSESKLVYSIKKKYKETTFTGSSQKIDVLLPFTSGEYYTENLINTDTLNYQLAKKKINLIADDSFSIYLDKFKIDKKHFYKQLTDIDIEYISLYNFYVYHKQTTKSRTNK